MRGRIAERTRERASANVANVLNPGRQWPYVALCD
jgi:hypothetical protein